jgi:threonine dehydrogenase-like Zn-dependent dehydrogenase
MKAVVFHGIGDIRLEDVADPQLQAPHDAIVRITASAICGTDLHMVRGTMSGMVPGTVLGHEGVGIVERVGPGVRNFKGGERVVITASIACGYCSYCRAGYFSKCDNANPNGKLAGTAFFGGPKSTGPFQGLQAEKARIPFANVNMVRLPDSISDEQAIMLSDIFPTGYFAADNAEIKPGDVVAVFGCGPVGQFAIASAKLKDAARILAIDTVESRLEMARAQGAECIDFNAEDPVEVIRELTGGIGPDRAIDAVGVDAECAHHGLAARQSKKKSQQFRQELKEVAPKTNPDGDNWHPGDAPSQALEWAVESVCKAGTLSIVGVYPPHDRFFPIGKAMAKNLTIKSGDCNHRRYVPTLINLIMSGVVDPSKILTQREPIGSVIDAYKAFDTRQEGWVKVELRPAA